MQFLKILGFFCIGLFTLSAGAVDIDDHKIFGRVESVLITDEHIKLRARMDTGAKTSSLGAIDIQSFEKDGKEWIRFTVDPTRTSKPHQFERPLVRYILIRKRFGELKDTSTIDKHKAVERRPVVSLPVCLGNQTKMVEVSLTNRSNFNYGMLLGRSGMESFEVLIDPARVFTAKPQCSSQIAT